MEKIHNYVKINDESVLEFGKNRWAGRKYDCRCFLEQLPYVTNKEHFLEDDCFCERLHNQFERFDLCDILFSALAFQYENACLSYLDWNAILFLLLNPAVSDCLFSFLEQNEFNEILEKEKIINGARWLFEKDSIFYLEEKCLYNFFKFLKVDPYKANLLISTTLEQNDFRVILNFLKNPKNVLTTKEF